MSEINYFRSINWNNLNSQQQPQSTQQQRQQQQPQVQRDDSAINSLRNQLATVDKKIADRQQSLKDSTFKRTLSNINDFFDPFNEGDAYINGLKSDRESILQNIRDIENSRRTAGASNEGGFGAALRRGAGQLKATVGALGAMVGDADETDVRRIVEGQAQSRAAGRNPEEQAQYERFQAADGFIASARELFGSRAGLNMMAQIAIESLPASAISLIGGTVGAVGGAAAGGVAGGPAGAVVGGRVGGAAGTGIGSFATEYGSAMLDTFQKNGVDVDDPNQLKAAIADPKIMAEARERGLRRGIAVGAFDALSAGLAGKLGGGQVAGRIIGDEATAGVGRRVAGTLAGGAAETVSQGVLGAGGEAAGQIAADGTITSPQDILAEFAGELPGGAVEATAGTAAEVYQGRQGNTRAGDNISNDRLDAALRTTIPDAPAAPAALPSPSRFDIDNADDTTTMKVKGLNLTPRQILQSAQQNESDPRIANILSQPVDPNTKAEQIARIHNGEDARRAEALIVPKIAPLIGGKTPLSQTRAAIQNELNQYGDEVIAESRVLSAMRDAIAADESGKPLMSGKQAVDTLRGAVTGFKPVTQQGQQFFSRNTRTSSGPGAPMVMTAEENVADIANDRNSEAAFELAAARQGRYEQQTFTGGQREDLRPNAPEPTDQFFLDPKKYGEALGGTPATVTEMTDRPGYVRIQYDSPTEVINDQPVTISEEVPMDALMGRVVRGTPRLTQDTAANQRKLRNGVGTEMAGPRDSIDRTSSRSLTETPPAGSLAVRPADPNLRYTGRFENADAQQQPVEDQPYIGGDVGGPALPAPEGNDPVVAAAAEASRSLPAPEATQRKEDATPTDQEAKLPRRIALDRRAIKLVKDGVITTRERFALQRETQNDTDAYEARIKELEQSAQADEDMLDVEEHPRMVEHNQKFDDAIERVSETENTSEARKLAKQLIREGLLDSDQYADIDGRIKDVPNSERHDEAMAAIEDALNEQRDATAEDIADEIRSEDPRYYSSREPRQKKAEQQPGGSMSAEEAQGIVDDAIAQLKERGQIGRIAAARIESLLQNKALSANEAIAAFRMADVASKIIRSKLNVDVQFVPDLRNPTTGEKVQGSFQPLPLGGDGFAGVIKLSLSQEWSGIFSETAAHEVFHVLQRALAYGGENAVKKYWLLNDSFKDGMTLDDLHPSLQRLFKNTIHPRFNESVWTVMQNDPIFQNDDGTMRQWSGFGPQEDTLTELQAYTFGYLNDALRYGGSRKGIAASILNAYDAIANFLEAVRNSIRGLGFTSTSKLWRDAASGKLSEQIGDVDISKDGGESVQFSARTKAAPARTQKAYKLFRVDERKPGQLFPLFVNANDAVPMGQWIDADVGPMTGDKVKSKLGPLAFRPGWHGGDLPIATHIGSKSKAGLKAPDTRPNNQVWAEVEFAADRDWQAEADKRARRNARGEIIANTAHITDQIPEDGFYRYKTNPNMTGNWLISGSMKVNRILTDDEVKQINDAAGTADLPRQTPFDAAKYGFAGGDTADDVQFSARTRNMASLENTFKMLEKRTFKKGRDLKVFIQNRIEPSLQRNGIDVNDFESKELLDYLTKSVVKDAQFAVNDNANAVGWYDEKVSKALSVLSLVHPEIATDPQSKFAFVWALAVTSNGLKVNPNFQLAEKAYSSYKETGRMPNNIGIGEASEAINQSLDLFNVMMDRFGFDELERLMTTKASVKEIEAKTGLKISGEGKNEQVFGAAILGPKIGNGFFANLYGYFDQLTMDRWLMRTWGRWTGTLIKADPENVAKSSERLQSLIGGLSEEDKATLSSIIKKDVTKEDAKTIAVAINKASVKPALREQMNQIAVGNADFLKSVLGEPKGNAKHVGIGDSIRKAGNTLAKYIDGQKEAPAGANERKFIRKVFSNALTTLQKTYPKLTMADLQALLWYPEKRLYEAAKTDEVEKGYEDDNAPDYANAAVLVARNAGIGDDQIRAALDGVDARRRADVSAAGAGRGDSGVSGEPVAANFSSRKPEDLAKRLANSFAGTPRVEEGAAREGNVGSRRGGVLASTVTGRVPVAATYSHSDAAKAVFAEHGYASPDFHELSRGKAAARLYARLINDSKSDNKFGASVYVYPEADYADMRLFVTKDGMAGFALKGDDIVSAFKSPKSTDEGVAYSMVRMAVALGGRRLDAFDTVLPTIYSVSKFRVASRMRWNDEYAPSDWSKDTFKAFNNGEPDVVFMAYDPARTDVYQPGEGEYTDDYDTAVSMQTAAVNGGQFSARRIVPTGDNAPLRPAPRFTDDNMNFGGNEPGQMDDIVYQLQDKLIDVKRLQQNIEKSGKKIGAEANVYRAEELYHGRAAKRAKDFVSRELNPLIEDMKSKGVSLEMLDEFLHARHAKERNAQIRKVNPDMQDGGAGMTDAKADSYMNSLPTARRNQLEKLAGRVDAIIQQTQKMMVDYGLETQETIDTWNNTYKSYVPLQREGFEDEAAGSGGQGMSIRGSSSKRAMGSERGVVDILANVAMQRERVITRGERNRVGNAMLQLAIQNPNDSFWFVVDPKSETLAKAKQKLIDFGIDPVDAENIVGAPVERFIDPRTGRLVVRPNTRLGGSNNVLATRVNGEDRFVIFNSRNPRAARTVVAMKNLDTPQIGGLLNVIGKGTRYFAAINTQYNPAFGLYNLMRDVQGAALNLTSTPLANDKAKVIGNTWSALRGMYGDLRTERKGGTGTSDWSKLAEEFELAGGMTGFRDLYRNSQERAEKIDQAISPSKLRRIIEKTGGPVFDWLSDFNESIENSVRLSAYKVARDKGMSKEEAASIAKNITVNFNRKGAAGTQAGMLYAFFNASVQGTARIAETLAGPAGKKIVMGGLLLGFAQAAALAAAGLGDDDLPDWLKDKNLIIPTGGGRYVAIPMPLGFHAIPAFSRRAAEFFMSGNKSASGSLIELMGVFADAFNPIGTGGTLAEMLSPTLTDPVVQLATNKDFSGRPISQEDFNNLDPTPGPDRTREGASIIGKAVSEAIDWMSGGNGYVPGKFSPTGDEVDFVIGTLTGGAGRTVLNSITTAKAAVTGEDVPNYKIPIVGRMIGDKNEKAAVSGRFYEGLKEVNGYQRTLKGMEEDGKDTTQFLKDNPAAVFAEEAADYERSVTALKRERKQLIEEGASKEDVALRTEELQQLMAEFNQRLDDAKRVK